MYIYYKFFQISYDKNCENYDGSHSIPTNFVTYNLVNPEHKKQHHYQWYNGKGEGNHTYTIAISRYSILNKTHNNIMIVVSMVPIWLYTTYMVNIWLTEF